MLHEEKVAASSDSFTQKCNIKQLSTLKRIKYNKREKPRASQGIAGKLGNLSQSKI